MATDIIFLTALKIETIIGIFDWERQIKQTVIIDVEMATDIRRAAQTDAIGDALDYKAVSKRVIEFVAASEFQLIETLAERTAALLIHEFSIPWIKLRVNKIGAIRGARDVGVLIERRLESTSE